jgi:hypothetical protein
MVSSTFNLAEISKKHPTIIARTILYLAVCLQQLDDDFDSTQLHLLPSIEARMDRYLTTVQALVTSDDEMVSTMEGLECLMLQGIFHINAGNPRRAWLTFRRALNTGQLMGIHRPDTEIPNGRTMWHQVVQGDRYLVRWLALYARTWLTYQGLLLGLPNGSVNDHFYPEETFQNPSCDTEQLFSRKLCELSGALADRNQSENPHAYAMTQSIDEKLDLLKKNMPESWWEIPVVTANKHSPEALAHFDRLMTHIWCFQLEALLHLPFMLRAATERRYDYNKFSCLKASREMIYRYLAMRDAAPNISFCCKIIDFGALTATVTLLLGLIEPAQGTETNETRQQKENDRNLVQTVLSSLEKLGKNGKNIIASQSSTIISSLLAVDSPAGRAAGNLRLTIPYFGTISIVRPPPSPANLTHTPGVEKQQAITIDHRLQAESSENNNGWPGMPFLAPTQTPADPMNLPVVSFTSTHYPSLVPDQSMQDWGLQEADNLYFDSLMNTDIEGNWVL